MPRRKRFGVLYCVCQVLLHNKDPNTKQRVPVVSKQRCGFPAPHQALANQYDDYSPEIPNLYGEPLCRTHAHLANEASAFPRPGDPLHDPSYPTAYSLREARRGPRRPRCRHSPPRCERFVVVPSEDEPRPMYCRFHTPRKIASYQASLTTLRRTCTHQKHARCAGLTVLFEAEVKDETVVCSSPSVRCSSNGASAWTYVGERRYVLLARARRRPCEAVRSVPSRSPSVGASD